jgi:hypothetical protein
MGYIKALFSAFALCLAVATFWGPRETLATSWYRYDYLCPGTWGEQGCEKTLCDAGGSSQCTATSCNVANCGEPI